MTRRENLIKIKYPALILAAVSFLIPLFLQVQGYIKQQGMISTALIVGAVVQWLVYSLVYQAIAYLLAYFLVIRRGKADSRIWFCYGICILIAAVGLVP